MTTDTDSVTVPDDLSAHFSIHLACRICYPDPEQAEAICGGRVMAGVVAPADSATCDACRDMVMEHISQHWS